MSKQKQKLKATTKGYWIGLGVGLNMFFQDYKFMPTMPTETTSRYQSKYQR
jgi:hypothetical protein